MFIMYFVYGLLLQGAKVFCIMQIQMVDAITITSGAGVTFACAIQAVLHTIQVNVAFPPWMDRMYLSLSVPLHQSSLPRS